METRREQVRVYSFKKPFIELCFSFPFTQTHSIDLSIAVFVQFVPSPSAFLFLLALCHIIQMESLQDNPILSIYACNETSPDARL